MKASLIEYLAVVVIVMALLFAVNKFYQRTVVRLTEHTAGRITDVR